MGTQEEVVLLGMPSVYTEAQTCPFLHVCPSQLKVSGTISSALLPHATHVSARSAPPNTRHRVIIFSSSSHGITAQVGARSTRV
jgi:hypothetical protein